MKLKNKRYYSCDFETSTEKWLEKDNNCARVWAWASMEIEDTFSNFKYGNSIESFLEYVKNLETGSHLYFHNLKFDSEYIINYLLQNGFEYVENKKDKKPNSFTTLISDMGSFYSIDLYFYHKSKKLKHIEISDSLKILNFSLEQIAKGFGLPLSKLTLDYDEYREVGHILTQHEVDYIKGDVEIVARAMYEFINLGFTKMTIGSNALNYYKNNIDFEFNRIFPTITNEEYEDIKSSYKGGFTYCNEVNQNKIIENIITFDINSMYPAILLNNKLPYGKSIYYLGKYIDDPDYPLYIQNISVDFEIKENKIPCIQIKHSLFFAYNEYIKSSNGIVTLTLTNIDLEMLLENYNIKSIKYNWGYKYKAKSGLFTNYVTYWGNQKIKASKEGNKAKRSIAKCMMNSLYGKYGSSNKAARKIPYIEGGITNYLISDDEDKKLVYPPLACFVTSYGRKQIITTSQKLRDFTLNKYGYDCYCYTDTDSCHAKLDYEIIDNKIILKDKELYDLIDIDDNKLGYFKVESISKRGKYLRQKCYIEEDLEGNIIATIAGMPKKLGKYITFENFNYGFTISKNDMSKEHKLSYKHVKGGVVLVETDFTIKY